MDNLQKNSVFSPAYWREALDVFKKPATLAVMSMVLALRVAVKLLKIPLAAGLSVTFDCYVNSVGSLIYGPIAALLVGAVSDTLGCIIAPTGPYFFPFILVEMLSGFIFALFFFRRKITLERCVLSKFTVNLICNIILTSIFIKWQCYVFYGIEKAEAYNLINGARIVKNLALFPIEAWLICAILSAIVPALSKIGIVPSKYAEIPDYKKSRVIIEVAATLVLSIALVLFYVFFLKDYISAHNIKFL